MKRAILSLICLIMVMSISCVSVRKIRTTYDESGSFVGEQVLSLNPEKGLFFTMRTIIDKTSSKFISLDCTKRDTMVRQEKWIFMDGLKDIQAAQRGDKGLLYYGNNFRNEGSKHDKGTESLTEVYSDYEHLRLDYHLDLLIGNWQAIDQTELDMLVPSNTMSNGLYFLLHLPGFVGDFRVIARIVNVGECAALEFVYSSDPKPNSESEIKNFLLISEKLDYNGIYAFYKSNNEFKSKVGIVENANFMELKVLQVLDVESDEMQLEVNATFEDVQGVSSVRKWERDASGPFTVSGRLLILPEIYQK